eukprot:gb/GECG01008930.1/.p1 GENE.gb/GECG01008930.1/~~gb/GECG01008930.1/.p1  ORF type:complete len:462 (+),score=78.38 gb/GECG01008930.1/:1-1386(+)
MDKDESGASAAAAAGGRRQRQRRHGRATRSRRNVTEEEAESSSSTPKDDEPEARGRRRETDEEEEGDDRKRSKRGDDESEHSSESRPSRRGRQSRRKTNRRQKSERLEPKDANAGGKGHDIAVVPMTQKHQAMTGRSDDREHRGAEAFDYLNKEKASENTKQVFEEDAATGEFHLVKRRDFKQGQEASTNTSDDAPAFPPAAYIASKLSQLFLFAGGLGAGASLLHVIIQFQFRDDSEFIQGVGLFNASVRILMYILVAIGWLNACLLYSESDLDFVATTRLPASLASLLQAPTHEITQETGDMRYHAMSWLRNYTTLAKRYGTAALIFNGVALIATLAGIRVDNRLSAVEDEPDQELRQQVIDNISLWRGTDVVRFLSLTLGWIMSLRVHLWVSLNIFETISEYQTLERKLRESETKRGAVEHQSPKESMSVEQLEKLLQQHKESMNDTEQALEKKKKSQ